MRLTGAELTIKLLERQGVKVISGIPGGSNLPLYDALYNSSIQHILARHEQACGFIAQGIARSTGQTAVCFATSGPGVTNLLTAIADAKIDSVPVVAITGQVSSDLLGKDSFQEIDTYGLTIPITKHNFLVRSAKELLQIIPESFKIAQSGRPGPVVVDIPKDVQQEIVEFDQWPEAYIAETEKDNKEIDKEDLEQAAQMINKAKKPILMAGGGVISSNASQMLYELSKKNNIPVVTTLMGMGSYPKNDNLYIGMVGMHGARYTNILMHEVDLIIAVGVRFDDRATGKVAKFSPNASIIHIDIDVCEVNKIKKANVPVEGDAGEVLKQLTLRVNEDNRKDWVENIQTAKKMHPFVIKKVEGTIHPIEYIQEISKLVNENAIVTTDVGQHQMWTAQGYPFTKPRTLLTSGGLGTMGFGLPAAIGAALANPDKKIICFSGDGSFLMNIQELATLADHDLNITIFIMNNGHLGLVRQQQELFYNKHYIASKFIKNPNFAQIANGFGITSYDLNGTDEDFSVIEKALSQNGPCLVNIPIHSAENVLPMVPPGKGNHEMIGGEANE